MEKNLRAKEEEIFTLTSERMSLGCDLKNSKLTESQLKQENHQLNAKRIDLEEIIAKLKSEVHSLGTSLR